MPLKFEMNLNCAFSLGERSSC